MGRLSTLLSFRDNVVRASLNAECAVDDMR